VSISFNIGGIPGNPVTETLGTSEADVFVPPADSAVYLVNSIVIANTDSLARVVDLYWNDGTTSYQFYKKLVAAEDTVEFSGLILPLQPGAGSGNGVAKKIRAKAAAAAVIQVTFSYTAIMPQQTYTR
jgi:hypothetical protein